MRCITVALILALLLPMGCGKQKKNVAPRRAPLPELPATVSFSATNEIVEAEKIVVEKTDKSVTADFNLDGLQDVVMIEHTPAGKEQVSIYIRKPSPVAPQDPAAPVFDVKTVSFFKAGIILPLTNGEIIGLMTHRGKDKYTDILLVVQCEDNRNEIVLYRNEGDQFVRAD